MRKNIQFLINNNQCDIDLKNFNVALTKTITDFNDITTRTGSFSYSINLPTSDTNVKIFKFINLIDAKENFSISKNYECSLYVNDTLLIDGFFILDKVTKNYFIGSIQNKNFDIYNQIGEKYLQDLKMPEIDYEGLIIPYGFGSGGLFNYQNPSQLSLNKQLNFNTTSLINGWKDPNDGLIGKTVDFREWYQSAFINYSNQYIPNQFGNNTFTSNLSLTDVMPRIRLIKVIKQIFADIGFFCDIQDDFLNDPNILIPFVGEDVLWNWLHLSKTLVGTSYQNLSTQEFRRNNGKTYAYWDNSQIPLVYSWDYEFWQNPGPDFPGLNFQPRYLTKRWGYEQYTNYKYSQADLSGIPTKWHKQFNGYATLHYTATNLITYDYGNNFNVQGQAPTTGPGRDSGWLYTCPADGEYEFQLSATHNMFRFLQWKYTQQTQIDNGIQNPDTDSDKANGMGGFAGYDGISYNSREKWLAQNMVVFADANFDLSSYMDTFNANLTVPQPGKNFTNSDTSKMLMNFLTDSVLAFYCPMLRDLYIGETGKTLEDLFRREESILTHYPTYPVTEEDKPNYMGFGPNTTITNYINEIYTNYDNAGLPNSEQKKRKLVKVGKTPYTTGTFLGLQKFPYTLRSAGEDYGNVFFSFKTKLTKGQQIRLYYITYNNIAQNYFTYGYREGTLARRFEAFPMVDDGFADEFTVSSLSVRCISDDLYSNKLKLSSFLPENIKQKDFIQDYLKSNNLYFDINSNNKNVVIKRRENFFSKKASEDFTKKVDTLDYDKTKVDTYKITEYGLNPLKSDDYYLTMNSENPVYSLDLSKNISSKDQTLNATSKIFYESYKKTFNYLQYNYVHNTRYVITNTDKKSYMILNFTEDGDGFEQNLNVTQSTMKREPRLILGNDERLEITKDGYLTLLGSTPFMGRENFSVNDANPYHTNDVIYNRLFNDSFLDLTKASLITYQMDLNDLDFARIDLSKPILIDNTLYYFQKIEDYDILNRKLTKVILLKI